jgi:hypothetical protein
VVGGRFLFVLLIDIDSKGTIPIFLIPFGRVLLPGFLVDFKVKFLRSEWYYS